MIWMDPAQLLTALREFSGDLITGYGVWGVAVAMMLESAGVPFVSTAVLLTAGGMILSGRADFGALLCASTAGIIAGSLISYFVGYLGCSVGRAVGHFINRNLLKTPTAVFRRRRLFPKYYLSWSGTELTRSSSVSYGELPAPLFLFLLARCR